jgi:uncharacterized membrane protein
MKSNITIGQYFADKLATGMGSWKFLIIQTIILFTWVIYNVVSSHEFDPYPFVFLNLLLSFQAAYSAPIIMMSSNRQEEIDRDRSIKIYDLEQDEHYKLEKMVVHIDNHFHKLNKRIDAIETQVSNQN